MIQGGQVSPHPVVQHRGLVIRDRIRLGGQLVRLVHEGQRGRAGDAGPHGEHAPLLGCQQRHELRRLRARPDQAHVAAQHVVELRQLVQVPLAQETAEAGDPGIARRADVRAHPVGAHHHGAELQDVEALPVQGHPLLTVERGAGRDPFGHHDREQDRGEHEQRQRRDHDVEHALPRPAVKSRKHRCPALPVARAGPA